MPAVPNGGGGQAPTSVGRRNPLDESQASLDADQPGEQQQGEPEPGSSSQDGPQPRAPE